MAFHHSMFGKKVWNQKPCSATEIHISSLLFRWKSSNTVLTSIILDKHRPFPAMPCNYALFYMLFVLRFTFLLTILKICSFLVNISQNVFFSLTNVKMSQKISPALCKRRMIYSIQLLAIYCLTLIVSYSTPHSHHPKKHSL